MKKIISIAVIMIFFTAIGINSMQSQKSNAFTDPSMDDRGEPKAPMAVADENVYLTWWTNKSGNWEVMFRASIDGGATFGDKINLSNTTDADSENAEIVALGNSVFISWWESSLQNATSESVLRISNDAGVTFGPLILLGQNGTIGDAEGEVDSEEIGEGVN